MRACEMIASCEFFIRYENSHNHKCKGFISCYCQGPLWDRCARKGYAHEKGAQPDRCMMPSGELIE